MKLILLCLLSFNLIYCMDKPEIDLTQIDTTQVDLEAGNQESFYNEKTGKIENCSSLFRTRKHHDLESQREILSKIAVSLEKFSDKTVKDSQSSSCMNKFTVTTTIGTIILSVVSIILTTYKS